MNTALSTGKRLVSKARKVLSIVGSVILLAAVLVAVLRLPGASDILERLGVRSASADPIVLYTDEGFVPNTLDVPLNSSVFFKNVSKEPMWPEADPFPTRDDYPQFNAGKAYRPGQTFIFQFTAKGTFGFHNREHPEHQGAVRVIDPARTDADISKTLEGQWPIRDRFLAMLVPGDPSSLFTIVDAIEADERIMLNCHEIAHDIGHEAYELYGFSGAMNFTDAVRLDHASVQDICAGGYVHGVLEEAARYQPHFEDNPGVMCAGVSKEGRASCFHGLGHALMFSIYRDADSALASCRTVGNAADASRCFEGVWMELFWGSTKYTGSESLGWDLKKPLEPCIRTQEDAKPACFLYSSFGYFRTHTKDYAGAIALCTQSGLRESDAKFCLKGVGITMISHFKAHHLERSETFVSGLSDGLKYAFYQGVIGYARFAGISVSELEATCAAFATDGAICTAILAAY